MGNLSTKWGIEKEPLAISQFSTEYQLDVEASGLIIDRHQPFLAASPDGLVGADSIIEVKCPASVKELTPTEGIEQKRSSSCSSKRV
jgi:YqaJ-like viral recombinase domain.